ncbi:MAG TPA: four-carbon acid sugar kinase family protein [Ktedonobacteraceae bacterium]|nr:four-carbon acid sugar kinase family protein [Ktedonobacteraceae bacterium]
MVGESSLKVPLGILADDLTGALDAAGPFASRGWHTQVVLDGQQFSFSAPIRAISTESRMLPPMEATTRVAQAACILNTPSLFKKLDSLLRGPIASEIHAVIDERNPDLVIIAPAFPAQGRTTLGGIQHAHGQPLDEHVIRDPFAPTQTGNLTHLLASEGIATQVIPLDVVRSTGEVLQRAFSEACSIGRVLVIDAERQKDLEHIARTSVASQKQILWCGTAGLASALAAILPQRPLFTLSPPVNRVLIVCGSLHPNSAQQCEYLRNQAEVKEIVLDRPLLHDPLRVAERIQQGFADETPCVLLQPGNLANHTTISMQREEVLTFLKQLASYLHGIPSLGLIATGGDTAAAIYRGFGLTHLEPSGMVSEGIPYSIGRRGQDHGITLVTKAGAFGDPSTLYNSMLSLVGKIS